MRHSLKTVWLHGTRKVRANLRPVDSPDGEADAHLELFKHGESAVTKRPRRRQPKKKFFAKQEPHSAVKSSIAAGYFSAWAPILTARSERVAYLDFFSGPGKYDDDSESTPLLVLRNIIANPKLHDKVVTYFGDRNKESINRLREAVQTLPGIDNVKHAPNIEAGAFTKSLQDELASTRLVPTLMFLDPFGYKVVNVDIIRAIIQNHGSECLFYFNYNRVMPAITNPGVRHLVDGIFGKDRVDKLREAFPSLKDVDKENAVIDALRESMKEIGGGFTLPFRFKKNGRTTHHLVFVSTHQLGHKIMKEIMGRQSSDYFQGVPSFEFRQGPLPTKMFDEPRPMDDLKASLLGTFAGQNITVELIFSRHNLGTPYIMSNYKTALKELMQSGLVPIGIRESGKRSLVSPYNTMPDDVVIRFPKI